MAGITGMQRGGNPAGLGLGGRTAGLERGVRSSPAAGLHCMHAAGRLWREALGVRGILDAQDIDE